MSVSVDGFVADREGGFGWTAPSEEMFRFHLAQISELGGYLTGRRLYETILVWETDSSLRDNELGAAFADVWRALRKVTFSRTLDSVQGNAADIPLSSRHRWRHALPAAGHRRRLARPRRDQTFGSRVIHERYVRARDSD